MPTDQQNAQERRRHPYRGRRGHERRPDRRNVPSQPTPDRSGVEFDQIMREIRARIAERQGVDLTTDQIQELAAHRLDAILDPRGLPPALLEALRRHAASPPALPEPAPPVDAVDEDVLLGPKGGLMHGLRRLLQPLLRLFVDPAAITGVLQAQGSLLRDLAAREAERDRRQAEWNALHYEILRRLATEVTRVSLEMQSLSLRVESLAARVDFADRRLRALDAPAAGSSRSVRAAEPAVAIGPVAIDEGGMTGEGDSARRKRRRRRSRKPGSGDRLLADPSAATGEAPEGDDAGDETDAAGAARHEISQEISDEPRTAGTERPLPVEPAAAPFVAEPPEHVHHRPDALAPGEPAAAPDTPGESTPRQEPVQDSLPPAPPEDAPDTDPRDR